MKLTIHRTDEDRLIRLCKQQDKQAQKELYERYAKHMLGVCIRYVKDDQEAEDIMIGAFVKIFDKLDQFKSQGSFEGWIRRIMVNESLTYLRRNKSMYLEVDIDEAQQQHTLDAQDTHLETEDLLTLIRNLPVGYRTVFNLYAIEGFSHKEIAAQLGIKVNTSKSQLSRARSLLQKQLHQMDQVLNTKIK